MLRARQRSHHTMRDSTASPTTCTGSLCRIAVRYAAWLMCNMLISIINYGYILTDTLLCWWRYAWRYLEPRKSRRKLAIVCTVNRCVRWYIKTLYSVLTLSLVSTVWCEAVTQKKCLHVTWNFLSASPRTAPLGRKSLLDVWWPYSVLRVATACSSSAGYVLDFQVNI